MARRVYHFVCHKVFAKRCKDDKNLPIRVFHSLVPCTMAAVRAPCDALYKILNTIFLCSHPCNFMLHAMHSICALQN